MIISYISFIFLRKNRENWEAKAMQQIISDRNWDDPPPGILVESPPKLGYIRLWHLCLVCSLFGSSHVLALMNSCGGLCRKELTAASYQWPGKSWGPLSNSSWGTKPCQQLSQWVWKKTWPTWGLQMRPWPKMAFWLKPCEALTHRTQLDCAQTLSEAQTLWDNKQLLF